MTRQNAISSIASKTCLARAYPALDIVGGDPDILAAQLDDFAPTAIEERDGGLRVFFASLASRDEARATLGASVRSTAIEVSDEDWAQRSQAHLQPVTVGRITVVSGPALARERAAGGAGLVIVIQPSMGFGTGHHATTRLCLSALQTVDVAGKTLLDVGTGSGLLAIAADRLGATSALGIDIDADAIHAARENLALNPTARRVRFEVADLAAPAVAPCDVVTANLTPWLLQRSAVTLLGLVNRGGVLILSGFQAQERDAVVRALAGAAILSERTEDGWTAVSVKKW